MLRAVYDACVLYPAALRDFLVWVAILGQHRNVVQAHWTAQIHDEWTRTVLASRPDLSRSQVNRTCELMNAAVADCLVSGYEGLIDTLTLPDPDDRHVLAAAIHARANLIVTFNLSDFPPAALVTHGVAAIHPDAFVLQLAAADEAAVIQAAREQRATLKRPPKTPEEFVATFEKQGVPQTAALLRDVLDQI